MVGLTCIPRQAQTHVRWAAAEQPRMCMCSQHMIEVLFGRHALPCSLSLHATALLMQAYPTFQPAEAVHCAIGPLPTMSAVWIAAYRMQL